MKNTNAFLEGFFSIYNIGDGIRQPQMFEYQDLKDKLIEYEFEVARQLKAINPRYGNWAGKPFEEKVIEDIRCDWNCVADDMRAAVEQVKQELGIYE